MNTRPHRRGSVLIAGLSLAAIAAGAFAQPVPETTDDERLLAHLGRTVTHGGTIWTFEGPHELRWQFGYDATPLTVDAIPIMIGLVNTGRPVSLVPPNLQLINSRVELTLRKPDGTEAHAAYPLGRPGYHSTTRAEPGGMVTGLVVDPRDHFGELTAGVYHLRVRLIVPQSLQRSRDQHEITPELDATTPELRFEILEREVPILDIGGDPLTLETDPVVFTEDHAGNLSNAVIPWPVSLYEPLLIRADLGAAGWPSVDPADTESLMLEGGPMRGRAPEHPIFAYGILERLTDKGWVPPRQVGFCGTGMGWLVVGPGHELKLSAHLPADTDAGVYRFLHNAQGVSGNPIVLYSPPFTVPLKPASQDE